MCADSSPAAKPHLNHPSDLNYPSAIAGAHPPLPLTPRPIVVIGAGGIVQAAHLPAYEKAGFPVIALADQAPGKAAELATAHSIAHAFDSAGQAIAFAPPDAIFDVAVPARHLLPILQLLPKRAAVLLQKPMGETLEEARSIRDLCRTRSLTAAVNFQLRFAPAHLAAQALAAAGLLGELHDIEVQVRTYTPWHLWSFLATARRLEILYHSIHYLDLVRSWLGNPRSIYAKTTRHPHCAQLAPTRSTMILDYGDSKRVFIATNHGHRFPRSSQLSFVQWEGTQGAMRMGMGVNLDYPKGEPDTLDFIQQADPEWHSAPIPGNWFPDAFIGSMGSLQAYVEGSSASLPTHFESAFETMALVEAAYRSSDRGGEPVLLA
jgi:predicted dehydrogenase